MKMGTGGSRLAVIITGVAGLALVLAFALSDGPQWPAEAPARAQVVRHCGDSENLFEWPSAVVDLTPDFGPAGVEIEVEVTNIPWDPMSRRIEALWHWDPDAGEGALIGDAIIGIDETSVTVDAVVPEWAEAGSNTVTACWLRPSSDTWFYKSAPFEVVEPTPTPTPTPTPSPTPTPTPTPTLKQIHNCPQAGKWAIAVWAGADETDSDEALSTCGEEVVDAAYALDPHTQSWLRWFADHPAFNTLDEVSNWQGVIAHAKAEPEPASQPTPSAANEMHNCPEAGNWTIAVWEGAEGTDTGEALGDCGEDVDAAYVLDVDTQNWLRWFPGKPEVSNLRTLKDKDGVIAHGKATFGPSARIAFASDRDGNQEIYTMNADGTVPTRLTNSAGEDNNPAWSPDRSKIAFASRRDGNWEIYVMNADGSGQTRITNNPADDVLPSWSPDGAKLAFTTTRDGSYDVYVMNADGSGQTSLGSNAAQDEFPAWSPDGSKIAFASYDGSWEVYVMNADGSGRTRLTYNGNSMAPAWSPDGSKIAFQYNGEIYVMNAGGTAQTNVTNSTQYDEDPTWSPDGAKLAFHSRVSAAGSYAADVYSMKADGTGQTNLTNNPAIDWEPAWAP